MSHLIKDLTGSRLAGDGVIFLGLVGLSLYMWWRAQQQKVDHSNVNADWDETTNSVVPADVRNKTAGGSEQAPPKSHHFGLTKGHVDALSGKYLQGAGRRPPVGSRLPALFATGMLAYSFGAVVRKRTM